MSFDLIALGDTALDTFLDLEDASVFCDLDKKNCQLCMNYADKIPVKSVHQTIGGNAANVAVGVSRLGLKSALATIIGDDAVGQQVKEKLETEKVDQSYVLIDKGKKTNYSTILNLQGERTILVYHEQRDYCPLHNLAPAKFAYLTSMKDGWECMLEEHGLLDWIEKNNVRVGYNPGTFQLKAGVTASKELLSKSEILFLNKEEANLWTGKQEVSESLEVLSKLGPKIVVITDGDKGSFAISEGKFYQEPIYPGERKEATGAGDAFATAFLSAIFYQKNIQEAMMWGAKNAVSVISQIGPQAGLLNRATIENITK